MKKIFIALTLLMIVTGCSNGENKENTILDVAGNPSTESIEGYTYRKVIDDGELFFKSREEMTLYEISIAEQEKAEEKELARIYKESPEVGYWRTETGEILDTIYYDIYEDSGNSTRFKATGTSSASIHQTDKWRSEKLDEEYSMKDETVADKYIRYGYLDGNEWSRHEVYTNDGGKTQKDMYYENELWGSAVKVEYDELPLEIQEYITANE